MVKPCRCRLLVPRRTVITARLKTDANGLTIKLQNGSVTLPLNQWFDFNNASPPTLYAVLEKQNGARFQDGQAFNATATLKVAYN